jgi:hypothetical protein
MRKQDIKRTLLKEGANMQSTRSRAKMWLKTDSEADLITQPLIGYGIISAISIDGDAEFYPAWHIHGFPDETLTTEEVARITDIDIKLIVEWEQFYADVYSRQWQDRVAGKTIPIDRDLGIGRKW